MRYLELGCSSSRSTVKARAQLRLDTLDVDTNKEALHKLIDQIPPDRFGQICKLVHHILYPSPPAAEPENDVFRRHLADASLFHVRLLGAFSDN